MPLKMVIFHSYVSLIPYPLAICDIAIENGSVEIVDLPIENGGSFHSFWYVYQRVIPYTIHQGPFRMLCLRGLGGLRGPAGPTQGGPGDMGR